MSGEWFRSSEWDSEIAKRFYEKLRRARRKEQYVRIQAGTLASTHPEAALALLDYYFTLPDDFDHAQAHVDRATAYVALGDPDAAARAYEDALAREAVFPRLRTQARVLLPFVIATAPLPRLYDRALELLQAHRADLPFPVERCQWHVSMALIQTARGTTSAREHATAALRLARVDDSGFRYHRKLGLVGKELGEWLPKMIEIAAER